MTGTLEGPGGLELRTKEHSRLVHFSEENSFGIEKCFQRNLNYIEVCHQRVFF